MTQHLSTEDYYDHHKLRPPSPATGILIASQPSRKPSQRRASCVPSIHHQNQNSPPLQSKQQHHYHHRRSSVQRKSMKKLTSYERSQSKPETVAQLSPSPVASSTNLRKSCSSTNLNVPQQSGFNMLRPSSASSQTTVSCHSNVPSINSSTVKINRSSSLIDQPAMDHTQIYYCDPSGIHSTRDQCDGDNSNNNNNNSNNTDDESSVHNNNNNNNNNNNVNNNNNNNYSSSFSKKKKNLWIEVKNLRESSQSRIEFLNIVIVTIIKDIGWLLLTIVISLFMITIGLSYISDCPVCKFIPYYLILAGIFGVLNQIFNYRIHRKTSDILEDHSRDSVVLRLTFIFICFIVGCGSYWVFKMYPPNYDPESGEEYCNKFVYLFAFWITIMIYVIVLLVPFVWYIIGAIKNSCNKKEKIIGSTMVSLTIDGGRINIENAV